MIVGDHDRDGRVDERLGAIESERDAVAVEVDQYLMNGPVVAVGKRGGAIARHGAVVANPPGRNAKHPQPLDTPWFASATAAKSGPMSRVRGLVT